MTLVRIAMAPAPRYRQSLLLRAVIALPLWLAASLPAMAQDSTAEPALDATSGATAPAPAATTPGGTGNGSSAMDFGDDTQPFDLSADQGIEWRSKEKTYTARGNALAKQGSSSIAADTLVFYTSGEGDQGSFDRILATGNVKVISGNSTGYGDKGDYSADQKLLLLTGGNLKIVSENDTVTARDRIEYWTGRSAITARGNAVVVREDTKINGDTATLYFVDDAEGKSKLSQIEAEGKVKVVTGTQTIFSKHFAYNPDTDIALMTGDVRILDKGNEYTGQRAEIDNKNKISRILGGGSTSRVHTFIKAKSSGTTTP
jgi:lipopolysaccharide export system protein LptA